MASSLTVLAITDLLSPGKPAVLGTPVDPYESIGVVPLAVPLIVGPATMTTSLLLVNTYAKTYSAPEQFGPHLGPVIVTLMVCLALLINIVPFSSSSSGTPPASSISLARTPSASSTKSS